MPKSLSAISKEIAQALQIRYVKLHFTIEFQEDTILPKHKVSAIRGGVGEMLLQANCVRDRKCENCDFCSECIVQRTMYSQFEIKPSFVTTGESVGYVYECTDYREKFLEGDRLEFNLLLFGKNIVYFNQYMQAIYALGQQGLGKNFSHFRVVEVRNSKQHPILSGDDSLNMANYEILRVEEYVEHRRAQIKSDLQSYKLTFVTPLTLKYQGEFIQEFRMDAITASVRRRIYMLDCFEGIDNEWYREMSTVPEVIKQESRLQGVERYSSRKNEKMMLRGIKGFLETGPMEEEVLAMLLAGELLHIGKNTSFGFGQYKLV